MADELSTWRPFRGLTSLREEMDRMWDRFFRDWPAPEIAREGWMPSVDLSETKDEILVKAEVPGMDPKDIDISLSDDLLTIRGEKKQENEEKEENYHRVERTYGSFSRSVRLPVGVQSSKVKANYKDGVLKIALPKSPEAKKKEVKIQVK